MLSDQPTFFQLPVFNKTETRTCRDMGKDQQQQNPPPKIKAKKCLFKQSPETSQHNLQALKMRTKKGQEDISSAENSRDCHAQIHVSAAALVAVSPAPLQGNQNFGEEQGIKNRTKHRNSLRGPVTPQPKVTNRIYLAPSTQKEALH